MPVRNAVKQVFQGAQTVVQAQPVRSAVQGVYQSVSSVQQANSVSYGSSGSQVVQSYGCVGSAIVSYSQPVVVSEWVVAPSQESSQVRALGVRSRKQSRQVIIEASEKALAEGSISASEAQAIRLAARSPRMLARMEDLILEKAQSSGAYSFALDRNGDVIKSAIDWEAIGDFILKIAPIIFKLIEMFAIVDQPQADAIAAESYSQPVNFVATIGSEFTAA